MPLSTDPKPSPSNVPSKKAAIDAFNPMVILVHLLRRYLTEIEGKPRYVTDVFFQKTRQKINRSSPQAAKDKTVAFYRLVEILHQDHQPLLKGIAASDHMRENERQVIEKILKYRGSAEEGTAILRMLHAIKKYETFRLRINQLVKRTDLSRPIPAQIPAGFVQYLEKLHDKRSTFTPMVLHIFEKAATSVRMGKLMATIFLVLNEARFVSTLKEVFPDLLTVHNHIDAFAQSYADIYLIKDDREPERAHYIRVSRLLKKSLKADVFLVRLNELPLIKLKPVGHPLMVILKSLIDRYPDFLHRLTHRVFLGSPSDALPRIPLDTIRRGLVQLYRYSDEQADQYIVRFTESIPHYYQKYLPADQRHQSHFFLLISALSRYSGELLAAIVKGNIFRDTETEVLMPLVQAIQLFSQAEDKPSAAAKIWDMLRPIRQKKEIRDDLTEIDRLTDSSTPVYLKEFVPYIDRLLKDPERFKLVFDYMFAQIRQDPDRHSRAVAWHVNLLNNIIRYLSDIAIVSDEDSRHILKSLIDRWLALYDTYLFDLIELLSVNHTGTLRGMLNYLYHQFPRTLIQLIESLLKLESSHHHGRADEYVRFIHTTLLELARIPGMSPTEIAREIENITQLFEDCCARMPGELKSRKQTIFSDAYLAAVAHLMTVDEDKEEKNEQPGVKDDALPSLIVDLIGQAAKLFSIPNFSKRAINNLAEIQDWVVAELESEGYAQSPLLEGISKLHNMFAMKYNFPQVSSNSVFHNFAQKNEFDYFSFVFLAYSVGKQLAWDEMMVKTGWRDVIITTVTGTEDLDLKKNEIADSTATINNKGRFFRDLKRLFAPLKAEIALEVFFHLKNGISLVDTRRYHLAMVSLEKAIQLHQTNIYAHYWRAVALKKAKINQEEYEKHMAVVERFYSNVTEIENLRKAPF
jgi:hypothetical protein